MLKSQNYAAANPYTGQAYRVDTDCKSGLKDWMECGVFLFFVSVGGFFHHGSVYENWSGTKRLDDITDLMPFGSCECPLTLMCALDVVVKKIITGLKMSRTQVIELTDFLRI